ncbi:CaiB/BaiF CoA transferase family protein [Solimonas marina]|uniref:CoA transferase n=1 Tax=Solimonas marina TaxID=2714601 RepID=A0A969WEF5_9GAMM|nr:CaiB/BaiF CoA-transferase family protein [Solimonas marina]NKF23836.1 CoA transferase [Solimonas marina]
MSNPLLAGVRVLDLSRLLPGPFCTLYLGQLGAEIVKIEEPGGEYGRTLSPELFALVNRNKRSLTLDLRKPEGVAVLRRLVADADVLIESFRPGVMDRLGCGYDALKALNPRLVYASLTGYGQSGPYRDRAGHDMNYCAYAGALDQIGNAAGPALSNTQIADLAGGALTCAIGILAALHGARASGHGCFVDSAMLDGTLALQVAALTSLRERGRTLPRGADMLTGALPNYRLYECADGRWFALGALEPKFWTAFCAAAGHPELAARDHDLKALHEQTAALFKTRSRDEWETLLAPHDACTSGIYTLEEALANEQVRARGLVDDSDGKPAIGMPLQFVDARPAPGRAAPAAGADTDDVLRALGLDDGALAQLRQAGAC